MFGNRPIEHQTLVYIPPLLLQRWRPSACMGRSPPRLTTRTSLHRASSLQFAVSTQINELTLVSRRAGISSAVLFFPALPPARVRG